MGAPVWARRLGAAIAAVAMVTAPAGGVSASGGGGTFGTFDVPSIGSIVVAPRWIDPRSDCGNARIYRVSRAGAVSIFAGAGAGGFDNGYDGDGGPAIDAHFGCITGPRVGPGRQPLVADHLNDVIRRIDAQGIVTTIAGSGPLFKWSHGFWRPNIKHTVTAGLPRRDPRRADGGSAWTRPEPVHRRPRSRRHPPGRDGRHHDRRRDRPARFRRRRRPGDGRKLNRPLGVASRAGGDC